MSWKETSTLERRLDFVLQAQRGEFSMSELCERFEVSRKSGYKWLARYRAEGLDGLSDRSRAPLHHPNAVAPELVGRLLKLKRCFPTWGPHKLLVHLAQTEPAHRWPAVSTAAQILGAHGLVRPRRRRGRVPAQAGALSPMDAPNAVWTVDFKGQFRTGDGRLCYPLTVCDGFSRYLLCCQGLVGTHTEPTQKVLERVFREHGLPRSLRSDNGSPFASRAVAGLSRLGVWLIKLGIRPERIAPGHPEQNGRHERMHRTLAEATAEPPRASLPAQQRAFDRFRTEYNEIRPHAALGMRTPAQCYHDSPRAFPRRLPQVHYAAPLQVRRVRSNGEIKWSGGLVFLSEVLVGEPVGLKQIDEALWCVHFSHLPIALLDERSMRIQPWEPPPQTPPPCAP